MSTQGKTVYRKDYTPPSFLIDTTELNFILNETATRVTAKLNLRRNPNALFSKDLTLDGENLTLLHAAIDNTELSANQYKATPDSLTIFDAPDSFVLETEVEINPTINTDLHGLYKDHSGMLSTQCEAEAFRRMTYYLDRPDVLSKFTTRIEADIKTYPVLLSNGNCIEKGKAANGNHFAIWQDPFPKPSYLFALVAGDLEHLEDSFTTMSGRKVALKLFTEKHNMHKTEYAMGALKRAMRWDEEKFGREYDLDIFMIVVVDSFNMAGMENKGLNIFNSSAVLASPDTTTDAEFVFIEDVVGHEYFHNWSGNRVTCQSWFELSLKEGFTVFRENDFSSDLNVRAVRRIADTSFLRVTQFTEDAGPMAHPIRPESYQAIDNFYTRTIYHKGAEVIAMIETILGAKDFRKGSDLYFKRHDGEAVTCEDFIKAMEDASNVDLAQFRNWYNQEGTPTLVVEESFSKVSKSYTLKIKQKVKPQQKPFHIPVKIGLLDNNGDDLTINTSSPAFDNMTQVLNVTNLEEEFTFTNINEEPIPSLLRNFSAPVKLEFNYSRDDLMFLMSNDNDGFNRWEAGQTLMISVIDELMQSIKNNKEHSVDERLIAACKSILESTINGDMPPALAAEALALPPFAYVCELQEEVDVDTIQAAFEFVRDTIASRLEPLFKECYNANQTNETYQPTAEQIGKRSLKNLCLNYLLNAGNSHNVKIALEQFNNNTNMTDITAALKCLVSSPYHEDAEEAMTSFYGKWKDDKLVTDKWLAIQASSNQEGTTNKVKELIKHPAFDIKIPNAVRAVIGAFANSGARNFHHSSGEGYKWFADSIIAIDAVNPIIAARIVAPLTEFRKYDTKRQNMMRTELERIFALNDKLSKNTYEVISIALNK